MSRTFRRVKKEYLIDTKNIKNQISNSIFRNINLERIYDDYFKNFNLEKSKFSKFPSKVKFILTKKIRSVLNQDIKKIKTINLEEIEIINYKKIDNKRNFL